MGIKHASFALSMLATAAAAAELPSSAPYTERGFLNDRLICASKKGASENIRFQMIRGNGHETWGGATVVDLSPRDGSARLPVEGLVPLAQVRSVRAPKQGRHIRYATKQGQIVLLLGEGVFDPMGLSYESQFVPGARRVVLGTTAYAGEIHFGFDKKPDLKFPLDCVAYASIPL